MPTKARIVKEHRQAPMRKHGYTRCPDCAFKLAWPFDEHCPECNCPFWPKAGHYAEKQASHKGTKPRRG